MNGIRCDKLSIVVAILRAYLGMHEKDFNAVVTFLTQYINKRAPTMSVKVASVGQTMPTKRQKTNVSSGTFKRKIYLKKNFRQEYNSMSTAHYQ